jgi:hypothetical protein
MRLRVLLVLLVIGGVGVGLSYAWLLEPVTFTESSPAQVSAVYREVWITMAAEAYAQDGDWIRTRARLDALREPNLIRTVDTLFERANAQGATALARALALVADRLGARTAEMSVYLFTPAVTATIAPTIVPTMMPTWTATATVMPRPVITATPQSKEPTPTSTATPIPPYRVVSRIAECTQPPAVPQIRVFVQDAAGQGVAGKEVWITWENGTDRLVTGFKPEIDPGYGDFDMALDQTYALSIDKATLVVLSGLQAEPCTGGGHLSWRLLLKPQ